MTAREVAAGVVAPGYVNVPLWAAQRRGFSGQEGLHVTSHVIGTVDCSCLDTALNGTPGRNRA